MNVAVSNPAAADVGAMDGLSSIRPEIESFISRENRSHADKWLQQVNWSENERTLTLYIQKPPSGDATDTRVNSSTAALRYTSLPGTTGYQVIRIPGSHPPLSSSSAHVRYQALAPFLFGPLRSVQIPPLLEGGRG